MSVAEPTVARLPSPWLRHLLATRPAFLSLTLVGCLLGLACAAVDGQFHAPIAALVSLTLALAIHAGANVINDVHDAEGDAINTRRLYPFTGGSRMIQNGVLTTGQMARLGHALLLLPIPAGLWLVGHSAPGLLAIGMTGLLLAWAYSAPPLRLSARGLGEPAIALTWLLVVVGCDFVQRQSFALTPLAAGAGFALLVANVLYIAQFPDADADATSGKRTLVVRLGPARARLGYPLIVLFAHGTPLAMILTGHLPPLALLALVSLWPGLWATRLLWHDGVTASTIRLTIAAAASHGLLLAAALVASASA